MPRPDLTEASRKQADRLERKLTETGVTPKRALRFKNSLYSMKEEDLVWLTEITESLSKSTGRVVSKSEIVRCGLRTLRGMSEEEVIRVLNTPID